MIKYLTFFTLLVVVVYFTFLLIDAYRYQKVYDRFQSQIKYYSGKQNELFWKASEAMTQGNFDLATDYNRQSKEVNDSANKAIEKCRVALNR